MSNLSLELECARAILKTYNQVNDTSTDSIQNTKNQPNLNEFQQIKDSEKELKNEIKQLQEKYALLQNELHDREELLAKLYRQLKDGTSNMTRLQEDYEHAILQLKILNETA